MHLHPDMRPAALLNIALPLDSTDLLRPDLLDCLIIVENGDDFYRVVLRRRGSIALTCYFDQLTDAATLYQIVCTDTGDLPLVVEDTASDLARALTRDHGLTVVAEPSDPVEVNR
jgi:hypothetical protein